MSGGEQRGMCLRVASPHTAGLNAADGDDKNHLQMNAHVFMQSNAENTAKLRLNVDFLC